MAIYLSWCRLSTGPCEAPRRDDAAAAGHGEEHQDLEGGESSDFLYGVLFREPQVI